MVTEERIRALSTRALAAVSALMLLTSLIALLIQPPLALPVILWRSLLITGAILLIVLARGLSGRNSAVLYLDAFVILLILIFLLFSGPDILISPKDLGAAFGYKVLAPVAVFVAGVLTAKDAINLLYGFGAKAREVLAFTLIRCSALFALLVLGGILSVIIYNGIGAIDIEFLTKPHRNLGQEGALRHASRGRSGSF